MKKLRVLLFLALASSCNFNADVNFYNEENEKQNAESVVALFHLYVSQDNYLKASELFSNSFYKTISKEKLMESLSKTNKVLGKFQDYKLEDWKTKRTNGSNALTEYLLIYKVKYSKAEAVETISLIKEGEFIKIVGYNISSEGFLNSNK